MPALLYNGHLPLSLRWPLSGRSTVEWFICYISNLIVFNYNLFYLEHGADLTATNNEGHTALSLAVGVGNKNGESPVEKG